MKKPEKKFSTLVVWGENPEEEHAKNPSKYSFATKAELDAFLLGLAEADGWLENRAFENAKEHKAWLKERE